VQVHEIVYNPTLQVILNAIYNNLLSHIHNFQVREIALVLINCLINPLIIPYAVSEILRSFLWIYALVVGGGSLDLEDVAHDEVLVIALALNEQCLDTLFVTSILDPASAFFGTIGGVEDRNHAAFVEPLDHVSDSRLSSSATHALAFSIVLVEEIGGGLRGIVSSVAAYVEDLSIDG
jgi:hypothetical protein